ncbi:hypothetical protein [Streptomyces sp. NPDC097981]|uniref:hypothetical protein n=1 Tax=Streptomyces sp. NPDC097981 TaxID=3155428 RepID=UPI00333188CD
MDREWAYRAVLAVDIERSAGRGNLALLAIREVLSTALRASFEQSGIAWESCLREDLGDGLRVVPPAGVRKTRLVHPLVHELAARLRAHNRTAGPATRIRVRIALHAGDVHLGRDGEVCGRPLEVLARLLDAAPARSALARAPQTTPAVLLLSQHFYEETVPHGHPGIEPDDFRKVTFTAKEYTADAWLHVPGQPVVVPQTPEAEAGAEAAAADGPRTPGRLKMVNKASGHGTVNALQSGVQHINITREP